MPEKIDTCEELPNADLEALCKAYVARENTTEASAAAHIMHYWGWARSQGLDEHDTFVGAMRHSVKLAGTYEAELKKAKARRARAAGVLPVQRAGRRAVISQSRRRPGGLRKYAPQLFEER